MQFERIRKNHKRKIIIGGLILICVISAITITTTRAKYKITQDIPLAKGTVNYNPDKTKPVITNVTTSVTKTEITVSVTASDNKEVTEYWYKIDNNEYIKDTPSTSTHKFTGLAAGSTHTIKVYVKDSSGNISEEVSKTVTTTSPTASEAILGNVTVNNGAPDFNKTSCTSGCGESTVGVYKANDNDGISYYFRGDVENNYVRFAGYWWRIIRINGDGSIRMIHYGSTIDKVTYYANNKIYNSLTYSPTYLGFKNNKPGFGSNIVESSERNDSYNIMTTNYSSSYYSKGYNYDRETGKFTLDQSEGNMISGKWSDIHDQVLNEGYIYTFTSSNPSFSSERIQKVTGYTPVTETGVYYYKKYVYMGYVSTSYENAVENVEESNALKELNIWYEENIKNQQDSNGNLLSKYLTDNIFCNDREINSGDGFNSFTKQTYYKSNSRVNTKSPSLICTQDNDKFTVSNDIGNGELTNPIGLITLDEALLAGTYTGNYSNKLFYLSYGSRTFFTMSPYYYDYNNGAVLYIVSSNGSLSSTYVQNSSMLRPVINLKANTKIVSGNGTPDSPFEITLG